MFKNIFTSVLVLLALFELTVQNIQLPQSFKVCPRNSPNLALCVKNSIEYLRPLLKTGDLGNGFKIAALEPISIDDIHLERGQGFYFNLLNIKAYNIHKFKIEKIRTSLEPKLQVDAILTIPNVETNANYKINLMLGILNLQGQGRIRGHIDEIKLRLRFEGVPFYRDGYEYRNITVSSTVKITNLVLRIEDLFKDKTLNAVGENLVNQNLYMFMPEIEKSVERSLARIGQEAGNGIFGRIPYNLLLP